MRATEGVLGITRALPHFQLLSRQPAAAAAPQGLGYGTGGYGGYGAPLNALTLRRRVTGGSRTAWLWNLHHSGKGWDARQAFISLVDEASNVIALRRAGAIAVADLANLKKLPKDAPLRVVFVTGSGAATWSQDDIAALATYLRGGGFLVVDSGGRDFYDGMIAALRQALPEAEFKRIAPAHEVFAGANMPYQLPNGCPIVEQGPTAGPAQGFYLDGKLVAFVSRGRLAKAWADKRTDQTEPAYRMGINLFSYALQR